jgi:hypothetical protein
MRTAYIHIGLEKTGTTALQIFLKNNYDALRLNNLDYMGDENKPYVHGIAHFPIVASFYAQCPNIIPLNKHSTSTQVLEALSRDSKSTSCDIILSCEHFSSRLYKRESLQAVQETLSDRQIKIICYLRPQDQQAISSYSTLVKSGETKPFTIVDVTPENRLFNYWKILEDWSTVFGRENIILREYRRDSLIKNDICLDFLDVLGVPPEDFISTGDQNPSLDTLQIELLRSINRHLISFPWGVWNINMEKFEESQEIRRKLTPLLPCGEHIGSLLPSDQRALVLDRFESENRKIFQTFDGADFIRYWHDRSIVESYSSTPSKLSLIDFERALISCGRELYSYSSKVEKLAEEIEILTEECDKAYQAIINLKEQHKSLRFTLKKSASNLVKNIKHFLRTSKKKKGNMK